MEWKEWRYILHKKGERRAKRNHGYERTSREGIRQQSAHTHKSREILTEPLADQKTTMWVNENQLR